MAYGLRRLCGTRTGLNKVGCWCLGFEITCLSCIEISSPSLIATGKNWLAGIGGTYAETRQRESLRVMSSCLVVVITLSVMLRCLVSNCWITI